mmetsp:Transcript_15157/g.41936  ORF Transcript_15157/g.41936 Transcript_15157/m.41936 type:complete len:248 (+) Transcript_15157:1874-2617(+)
MPQSYSFLFRCFSTLFLKTVKHSFHFIGQLLGWKEFEFVTGDIDLSHNIRVLVVDRKYPRFQQVEIWIVLLDLSLNPSAGVFAIRLMTCQQDAGIPYLSNFAYDIGVTLGRVRNRIESNNVEPPTGLEQFGHLWYDQVLFVRRESIHCPNQIIHYDCVVLLLLRCEHFIQWFSTKPISNQNFSQVGHLQFICQGLNPRLHALVCRNGGKLSQVLGWILGEAGDPTQTLLSSASIQKIAKQAFPVDLF